MGPTPARERAARRLEAFIAAEASRRLHRLAALKAAVADGRLKGLARGVAYRLTEAGGAIDRRTVEAEVRALSQAERRALRGLGVRFGAFSLFLPDLLAAPARDVARAFAQLAAPEWRPPPDRPSRLPDPPPPASALAAFGLRAVGPLAAPIEQLEALDAAIRAAPRKAGGALIGDGVFQALGWSSDEAEAILRGLGFVPARKPATGQASLWRRRQAAPTVPAAKPKAASPFAALAQLAPARPARRPARRRTPGRGGSGRRAS
jgi:ATP-dependent RNA helicase SUPV3L1/SUV3